MNGSWINVKDKLPEKHVNVLMRISVCSDFNIVQGYLTDDGRWVDCWFMYTNGYKIKHWMPLPSPPKE